MLRRIRLLVALPLVAVLVLGAPSVQADPIVLPDPLAPIDAGRELSCTELVPHAVSLESRKVRLDLRILLDGTTRAQASGAVRAMRKAYSPLAISVAPTYEKVRFRGTDADK